MTENSFEYIISYTVQIVQDKVTKYLEIYCFR
jgi:hypothetical protein